MLAFALLTRSSAQSRGATLFTHNVERDCGIFFGNVFVIPFSARHFFPPRRCRSCHLPFEVFVVSLYAPLPCQWPAGVYLARRFACISACVPFHFDDGSSCHSAFSCVFFCRGAFSVSPSLATPVVRGRSLMGRLLYYRVCVFFNCFSSRVFLASQPGCQGCGSAL